MPVVLIEGNDPCAAFEGSFEVVGVRVEVCFANPADQFADAWVSYGDSCEPHSALLHESKCRLAGSAAHDEPYTGAGRERPGTGGEEWRDGSWVPAPKLGDVIPVEAAR